MTTILLLPYEILLNIFNQMDNVAQVATCRLVCQMWNRPAEIVMFGKEIPIKSEEQALQLYGHLCKDPSKGKLIKHMHFSIESKHLPLIYKHLLPLAFTPTIESLTGIVRASSFYTILMDIAGNTCSQFSRLKKFPKGCKSRDFRTLVDFTAKFNNQQLCLITRPSSINDIHRNSSINPITEDAHSLKNLLFDQCFTRGWQDMETSLRHCPNLKVLLILYPTLERTEMSRAEINAWVITTNVSKAFSLETIWLKTSALCPGLVEYLTYKYPNVRSIKLRCSPNFIEFNHLSRILNAVNSVQQKDVTFWFPANVSMDGLMQFAASRSEKINFQMEVLAGENRLAMKIN